MTPRTQMSYLGERPEIGVPLLRESTSSLDSLTDDKEVTKGNLSERYLRYLMSFSTGLGCSYGVLVPLGIVGAYKLMGYLFARLQIELDSQKSAVLMVGFWNLIFALLVLYGRYLYCGVLLGRFQTNGIPEHTVNNIKFMLWRTFSMGILLGILIPEVLLEISCFFVETSVCRVTSPALTGATVLLTLIVGHSLYCETHSNLPIEDIGVKKGNYQASITVV